MLKKNFFFGFFLEKMLFGCAYGRKNWGAGACAAHYENVCDVRTDADENLRTLNVWKFEIIFWILVTS